MMPAPAAAQPMNHPRQSGPRSRWRNKPYAESVIQNVIVASICAAFAWKEKWMQVQSIAAARIPARCVANRRARS